MWGKKGPVRATNILKNNSRVIYRLSILSLSYFQSSQMDCSHCARQRPRSLHPLVAPAAKLKALNQASKLREENWNRWKLLILPIIKFCFSFPFLQQNFFIIASGRKDSVWDDGISSTDHQSSVRRSVKVYKQKKAGFISGKEDPRRNTAVFGVWEVTSSNRRSYAQGGKKLRVRKS